MAWVVGSCKLTQADETHFTLTLSGIDYTPDNPPTLDSTGARPLGWLAGCLRRAAGDEV
jgi:hypothetical protein